MRSIVAVGSLRGVIRWFMTLQERKFVILTFAIFGVWIVTWATGLAGRFTSESVRRLVAGTGPWGIIVFTLIFTGGQLLRVLSTVFVAAAVAMYGRNTALLSHYSAA